MRPRLLAQNPTPLSYEDLPEPKIDAGEVLIRVTVAEYVIPNWMKSKGECHLAYLPIVLGHQVVGIVVSRSDDFSRPQKATKVVTTGQRVGVAWIASACGTCPHCLSGNENLCAEFKATGRDIDGGYAEYMKVRADFVHPIPDSFSDSEAAPLLCAGAIGYRSLRLSNLQDGQSLGLMGFGGSNHLVLKLAKHKFPKSNIFVFSRNAEEREFALIAGSGLGGDD